MLADVFNSWAAPATGIAAVMALLGGSFAIFRFAIKTDQANRTALLEQLATERKEAAEKIVSLEKKQDDQDKLHREAQGRLQDQLTNSSKREDRCERRLNILVNACNEQGVKVPSEVWSLDA